MTSPTRTSGSWHRTAGQQWPEHMWRTLAARPQVAIGPGRLRHLRPSFREVSQLKGMRDEHPPARPSLVPPSLPSAPHPLPVRTCTTPRPDPAGLPAIRLSGTKPVTQRNHALAGQQSSSTSSRKDRRPARSDALLHSAGAAVAFYISMATSAPVGSGLTPVLARDFVVISAGVPKVSATTRRSSLALGTLRASAGDGSLDSPGRVH
jgi:hypothetical protein